jgi:hypothetical protein
MTFSLLPSKPWPSLNLTEPHSTRSWLFSYRSSITDRVAYVPSCVPIQSRHFLLHPTFTEELTGIARGAITHDLAGAPSACNLCQVPLIYNLTSGLTDLFLPVSNKYCGERESTPKSHSSQLNTQDRTHIHTRIPLSSTVKHTTQNTQTTQRSVIPSQKSPFLQLH